MLGLAAAAAARGLKCLRTERAKGRTVLRQGCFQNEYPELVRLGSYTIERVAEAPDGACSVRVAVEPAPGVRPSCKALGLRSSALAACIGRRMAWPASLAGSRLEHSGRT